MTHRKWILLAEDDPQDADLAVRTLGTMFLPDSVVVVVVHDGEEALKCLYQRNEPASKDKSHPTMILLDLKMPKMDGLDVLRQIKSDIRLKTIPVVMFTSSREESDLTRSYGLGANAYVVKPLEFRQFVAALERVKSFWMEINEPPPEGILNYGNGPPQPASIN